MEKRVYNFSAGPSMLPLEVLEQAQRELVCYPSAGMSVMEMSHRSKVFESILEKAKAECTRYLSVLNSLVKIDFKYAQEVAK